MILPGFLNNEYDRNMAYPIAEKFNIKYREMPCLAFFKDLDSEFIIYKFDNTPDQNIDDQLRAIFDTIRIDPRDRLPFELWRDRRWTKLNDFINNLIAKEKGERRKAWIINAAKTARDIFKDLSVLIQRQ
jgi:hypothetical protein